MKKIRVVVRKKGMGGKPLTLLNLRDEVVNFLYRDTVAHATKADQQFFILMYFVSLKAGEEPYLKVFFDAVLPRFHKLSVALSQKSTYLAAREYRARAKEFGLTEFFTGDTFFVLAEAVLDIESIEDRYKDLYKDKPEIEAVMRLLKTEYHPRIAEDYVLFASSRIRDDRYDDEGNVHDLSKSVYRTIQMRNARNLELNLQRYTRVKQVSSNSPILLELIQNVDPQIIFDLWDKYHLGNYVRGTWEFLNSPVISSVTGGFISMLLFEKYREHRAINGGIDPKRKRAAQQAFQLAKAQHPEGLDDLNMRLVESVLNANQYLAKEVDRLNAELHEVQDRSPANQDKEMIKKLKTRIAELEGLEISAEEADDAQQSADNANLAK